MLRSIVNYPSLISSTLNPGQNIVENVVVGVFHALFLGRVVSVRRNRLTREARTSTFHYVNSAFGEVLICIAQGIKRSTKCVSKAFHIEICTNFANKTFSAREKRTIAFLKS